MNRNKRIFWSLVLSIMPFGARRIADIIRKNNLYGSVGENCYIQKRKIPNYSELIFLHNNICIGSDVGLTVHDACHIMLNGKYGRNTFIEKIGCIEIMDNVFIGAGAHILGNVRIGSNVIIGSNSLVNKDIPDNSVYSGIPAKYICDFDDYVGYMTDYSEQFRLEFGINRICGLDKDMASKIYKSFLKEKDKKKAKK